MLRPGVLLTLRQGVGLAWAADFVRSALRLCVAEARAIIWRWTGNASNPEAFRYRVPSL